MGGDGLFDYFTTWAIVAQIAGIVVQAIVRLCGCRASFPANLVVISSVVVGVVGSWIVENNMCAPGVGDRPGSLAKSTLSCHLYMHILPMAASLVLLMAWKQLVGAPPSMGSIVAALGVLGVLFASYLATPSRGATWLRKLEQTYHTQQPRSLIGGGAAAAAATALLLALYGRNASSATQA